MFQKPNSFNPKIIKEKVDIVDLIKDQVNLKKEGSNLVGLCPFHVEKTPSFTVFLETQTFNCFGCNKQGDAIDYIQESEGLPFQDAMKFLVEKYQIEIPDYKNNDQSQNSDYQKKEEIFLTNETAKDHFKDNLGEDKKKFLYDKGLTNETIEKFELGFSSREKPLYKLAEFPEFSLDSFVDAGLVKISDSEKSFDFFWDPGIMFPIKNKNGKTIAFARRSETSDIKYLNTSETLAYKKNENLYGLDLAKKSIKEKDEVIIVEGYTDVMAMQQLGYFNTVGISGTAFTEKHLMKLLKLTKNICLIFDGDSAGMKALEKAIIMCVEKGANVRCVILPEKTDPCDLLKMEEVTITKILESQKQDGVLYYCNSQIKDKISPIDKAYAFNKVGLLLSKIQETSLFETYLSDICQRYKIGKRALQKIVKEQRAKRKINNDNISDAIVNGIDKVSHIKVRDTYFEKYVNYDSEFDSYSVTWVTRKATELKREFGEKYLNEIPRFNGITVEPEHFNFKFSHSFHHENRLYRNANFYHQIPHLPKAFELMLDWDKCEEYDITRFAEVKNTLEYIKHVFGVDWMKALDYFSILYRYPKHPLPALCLVSRQKGTGKSTLINLMRAIFGDNVTKSSAKRLFSNFNKFLLGKLIVGIEETKDEKGTIQEELKDMITGREIVIEGKGQDSFIVPSYIKLIFCSNYPETFLKGGDDDRLIVIEVPVIPPHKKDNNLLEKMVKEIPYFLYLLENRKIRTPNKGRLWFEVWETPALHRLREASQPSTKKFVKDLISAFFTKCKFYDNSTGKCLRSIKLSSKLSSKLLAHFLNKYNSTNSFKPYKLTQALMQQGFQQSKYSTTFNYPRIDVEALGEWNFEWGKETAKYYVFDILDYVQKEEIIELYSNEDMKQMFGEEELEKLGLLSFNQTMDNSDEGLLF